MMGWALNCFALSDLWLNKQIETQLAKFHLSTFAMEHSQN
jgi:hypothetical protein